MDLSPGITLSHYRIISRIGPGGMGEVYLGEDLQARSKTQFVPSYSIATVYAGLGMKKEALQCLVKSFEEGSFYMSHLKIEPIPDPLRADPRFADLVRRVGDGQ